MRADKYSINNPSKMTTALAAWMSLASLGRNATAKRAKVAEPTMTSAMNGSVRLSTAKMIAEVVRIDADIICAGELRASWEFSLRTDGIIEVLP